MGVGRKGVGRWAVAVLGCVALLLVLAPAALAAEGTGTIAGKVTEAPDAGVGGVNVEVITANREFVGFAITEESGKYEVTGLAAGSYKVEFVPKNGSMDAPQFYSGKPSFSEATEVAVQAGMTHSEVNAELHEGGMIAGTVTGVGADGLEHVSVFVSIAGEEFISGSAVTGAGGKYKVTGLPTGRRSGGRVRVSRIWLFCMESCVGDSSGGRGDRGAGRRGRRRGVALDGGADRGVGAAVGAELE